MAQTYNLELIDIRLSGYEPSDLSGLPFRDGDKSRFLPTDLIPIEGDEIPEGKDGWLVLLDEFNHAHPSMIRLSYKLLHDKMVGQFNVHENVIIALAGNRMQDNALTNAVGSAANSRVTHLNLGVDPKQWMEDFAIPADLDYRIQGFINAFPDRLNDFNPDDDSQLEHSFCCPRTWHNVSKIIKGNKAIGDLSAAIVGTLSVGTAYEFIQFCSVYDSLVTIGQVLKDPLACPIPTDSATKWATTSMLAMNVDASNLQAFHEYVERYPIDNRIIFMRNIAYRNPELAKTQVHRDFQIKLGKYINA